jgi:hypothetical protein
MKASTIFLAVFCAFFLLLITESQAQRPRYRPQVHELGVQLYTANLPQDDRAFYDESPLLNHNPLNGFRYKYHINLRNAFRLGASYRANRYASSPLGNLPAYEARWRAGEISLGVERKLHLRKVQLFAALDGLLSYGGIRQSQADSTLSSSRLTTYGARISAGFRYFFSPYASLTVENGFYLMQSSLPDPAPNADLAPPPVMTGQESGFNLLSVSFSVHFKRMPKNCTCGRPGR